ncbi:uncharacterized protein [Anser cygnoides]|uniref:uncharacterized protein n=1 Tax=Anser cygnoides TaxID=8845 RepID=UPI0034D29E2B
MSAGQDTVTVLTTTVFNQEHSTPHFVSTSSSTASPLPSRAVASAAIPSTTRTSLGESPTMAQVSGTTSDARDETSIALLPTSLSAASVVTKAAREERTQTAPTVPSRSGSSLGVSVGSEATSAAYTSMSLDSSATSVGTVSGSASSVSVTARSTAGSDSPSLAGSSAAPFSSGPRISSGNTEPSLSATARPSTVLTSAVPGSTDGTTTTERGTVTVLTTTNLNQEQATPHFVPTSSSMASPLPSRAVASAGSPSTSRTGLGESATMGLVSGTTSDARDETSISLPPTSLSVASVVTTAAGEERTQTAPTVPSRTGSSLRVSGVSQATTVGYTSMSRDNNATSMVTVTGSARSTSPMSSMAGGSDSPSLAGTSAVPFSSGSSSSSSSAEPSLSATSQPSTGLPSPVPWSTAGSMSAGRDTVTVLTTTVFNQEHSTPHFVSTSSSTASPLPSRAVASAGSPSTSRTGLGESATMGLVSGTTSDARDETSISLLPTSLSAASVVTTAAGEERTQMAPTVPSRSGSSLGVSVGSEATSAAYTSMSLDSSATSVGTVSGSANSVSMTAISTAGSDSPSLAGSSAAPFSSGPRISSGSTEPSLSATAQPSTILNSVPGSTDGTTTTERGTVTVLTMTVFNQEHSTPHFVSTSSSTASPLPSRAVASASSPSTTRSGLGESPTMAQVSGTTSDARDETSISLLPTSLSAASVVTTVAGEERTQTMPTVPSRSGSSLGVSVGSEATSAAYTSMSLDSSATSIDTSSGSASSVSVTARSTAGSDSPSLAGSSAAPFSSGPRISSGNTEPSLSATAQPSTVLTSAVPGSTDGTTTTERGTVTVLTTTNLNQEQATQNFVSTSSSMASPLPSRAVASAGSPSTSRTGLGESATMGLVSGTTSDARDETSISLPPTSLSVASVVTKAAGEERTQTAPTVPSRTGSSLRVSGVSQATTVGYTSMSRDNNATSMVTVTGSARSTSPMSSMAGGSDSPSLAGTSAAPFSSGSSSSSSSAEPSLSATSQPSTGLPSPVPWSTAGTMSAGRDTVTVLTTTVFNQEHSTPHFVSTSSSTASPLPSRAVASAAIPSTSRTGLGESPTMGLVSGTTSDARDETSISLLPTSLSAASVVTTAAEEERTQTAPTVPSRSGSSLGVSVGSEATSAAYTSMSLDSSATSVDTSSGSASSVSVTARSTAGSDSPSLAGSSAAPFSSGPRISSGNTEPSLSATAQPSTVLTSAVPGSTDGTTTTERGTVTVLTTTVFNQEHSTPHFASTSSSTASPLPSRAVASAPSPFTTRTGLGESATMGLVSGTTSDARDKTSFSLGPTSVSAASVVTVAVGEGSMRTTIYKAKFSLPASVHPPLSGSCTPVTLSIRLENVTSTTIQFSWKPQGGTRDSPYRVRLWEGSREMENRNINETSIAFGNLLSDYEYRISVDVLTCSMNISTSMTVRTAAKVLNGTTRITNEDFIPEYENKSSKAFKDFKTRFIMQIKEHLPMEILKLIVEGKMRIVINSIRNGSVVVFFNIVLNVGENITVTEISDAFTKSLNMSTVLKADLKRTVIEARNSCQPGLNDCSQHATCTAEGASYSCQCNKGFTDNSPQVPGRVCQQKQNPPSQQVTTVPPKSATGIFTGSTTNSSFAATFASGACMPVSINVENVTGEAIQFSWTTEGGKRGILYTISLVDGNRERNRTTNETKTIFKHLLPGRVYTISVKVLSCAENSRTSVSVRTDPVSCFNRTGFCIPQNHGCPDLKYVICSNYQVFACSALLKSQTFNHTLYDSDSEDYKAMSESIKTEIVREMRIKLKDDHFDIVMVGFRPGSVIAYFISLLQKQEPVGVNVVREYLSQILKRKFGDQVEVTVQSLSSQSSTEKTSSWKVAVIVLGVLLGIALVVIFLVISVYIWTKKRSGKYLVEPRELLGNFVYKHL